MRHHRALFPLNLPRQVLRSPPTHGRILPRVNAIWWETAIVTTQHLDQTDLARRWKLSPRTLERWRWLGQGPRYLKIGGRVVYRLDEIEAVESASLHANTIGPLADQSDSGDAHGHR